MTNSPQVFQKTPDDDPLRDTVTEYAAAHCLSLNDDSEFLPAVSQISEFMASYTVKSVRSYERSMLEQREILSQLQAKYQDLEHQKSNALSQYAMLASTSCNARLAVEALECFGFCRHCDRQIKASVRVLDGGTWDMRCANCNTRLR